MPKKPIAVKIVERLASNSLLHTFDRLENGEKRGTGKSLRQNTRSADASIRSRSRGARLSRVVKSTGTPSSALPQLFDSDQLDKRKMAVAIVFDEEIKIAL